MQERIYYRPFKFVPAVAVKIADKPLSVLELLKKVARY
jgi:hypothetical protein